MAEVVIGDFAGFLFVLGLAMAVVAVVTALGFIATALWRFVDSDWHKYTLGILPEEPDVAADALTGAIGA